MLANTELKIAVVDDMEQDCVQITDMAKCILCNAKISHSIDCYTDGKSLLDNLHSDKKYNLLLLDVLMDDMDGMALAAELRKQGIKP